MKLILSIFLSLLSLNLFAADGALGTASGTTTVGTIPAGNLPALGVAYPAALTNNSTVAWTNTDNITALTFSGAGSGQGILQLSNAAATGLTVILGPSNAFANVAFFTNSVRIEGEQDLVGTTNYISGNVRRDGGTFYPTNLAAAATFTKPWAMTNIAAAYTQAGPIGVDTTLTMFQQTLYTVTNNSGAAVLVTLPGGLKKATWWGTNVTGFYVTNATIQWWTCRPGETNVYIEGGY